MLGAQHLSLGGGVLVKGLILAAGEGSRLRPFTFSRPKHLIPILGKPMIQYSLEDLV
ncbi:MAG: sugar phosphate nucleotidyltransferase, partial [Desulfurococcus sp.]|uniref:sugar phosphate nucleotidyltransferase n=1 Tax=Desulfurococcus sp. TaxID=51678 RepID=UPI00315E3797